jgi:hypothetical protein
MLPLHIQVIVAIVLHHSPSDTLRPPLPPFRLAIFIVTSSTDLLRWRYLQERINRIAKYKEGFHVCRLAIAFDKKSSLQGAREREERTISTSTALRLQMIRGPT